MQDKYHGHGGSYVIDPKTGEKTLVHRTSHSSDEMLAEKKQEQKKSKPRISED